MAAILSGGGGGGGGGGGWVNIDFQDADAASCRLMYADTQLNMYAYIYAHIPFIKCLYICMTMCFVYISFYVSIISNAQISESLLLWL